MKQSKNMWKFMVVDDDEDDVFILRDTLDRIENFEYVLDWFPENTHLISLITSGQYDAVFMEYRIGPLSGLDIIRTVRGMGNHIPILLASEWEIPGKDLWDEAMRVETSLFIQKGDLTVALLKKHLCQVLPDFPR